MRPISFVLGEVCLISAAKLASSSSVVMAETPPVLSRSKMAGRLRSTCRPSLLGGPGGKGVPCGGGVGVGGTLVGVLVGSGVSVGSWATLTSSSGWLAAMGRYACDSGWGVLSGLDRNDRNDGVLVLVGVAVGIGVGGVFLHAANAHAAAVPNAPAKKRRRLGCSWGAVLPVLGGDSRFDWSGWLSAGGVMVSVWRIPMLYFTMDQHLVII